MSVWHAFVHSKNRYQYEFGMHAHAPAPRAAGWIRIRIKIYWNEPIWAVRRVLFKMGIMPIFDAEIVPSYK